MSKGKKKSSRNSDGVGPSNITFSGAFVLSTARKFKIEGAKQIEAFRRFLGCAAGIYFASADALPAERQQVRLRKELEAMATLHRKYRASLAGLSPLARDRLWSSPPPSHPGHSKPKFAVLYGNGAPTGNRTPVSALRGPRPDR